MTYVDFQKAARSTRIFRISVRSDGNGVVPLLNNISGVSSFTIRSRYPSLVSVHIERKIITILRAVSLIGEMSFRGTLSINAAISKATEVFIGNVLTCRCDNTRRGWLGVRLCRIAHSSALRWIDLYYKQSSRLTASLEVCKRFSLFFFVQNDDPVRSINSMQDGVQLLYLSQHLA